MAERSPGSASPVPEALGRPGVPQYCQTGSIADSMCEGSTLRLPRSREVARVVARAVGGGLIVATVAQLARQRNGTSASRLFLSEASRTAPCQIDDGHS